MQILKRREPVAEIVPIRKPNKPVDAAKLNASARRNRGRR
nr:hypothetical protein [Rhizobium gallicum]